MYILLRQKTFQGDWASRKIKGVVCQHYPQEPKVERAYHRGICGLSFVQWSGPQKDTQAIQKCCKELYQYKQGWIELKGPEGVRNERPLDAQTLEGNGLRSLLFCKHTTSHGKGGIAQSKQNPRRQSHELRRVSSGLRKE